MERKNKIKKYEGVYFFLAIALIILSILINLDYTSLNITGRVVEQIYNFSTPLEPSSTRNETDSTSSTLTLPVGTGTSNTTTSTSETMISSSETTSTLELTTTSTILEINNTIRLSNSGFFAQAGIDVINEPQNATENYLGAINIILNFTIGGAYNANENETVRVYGWREGESPYDHLLYKYMHPNGSNIIYNWTAPTANYSDTTGDNGLVVYLKFDNESNFGDNEIIEQFGKNSTIFDWSPIHINGTLVQGGAGGSAGGNIARINRTSKFGWGLDFNSSSCTPICTAPGFSYINITQIKLNGSFSWGAWVYSMNTSSEQEVIDKMAGTGTIRTFIDNAGKANCALTGDNGAGATTVTDSVVLGAFNWHHIACVRDVTDDGLWLFVDGKFKNKGQDGTTNNVTTNIKIGLAQGGSSPFNGTIDEVAVWNRSLGLLEIANLYRLGFGRYYWKVNVTNLSGTGVESATQTFTIDLPPYVPYGKWDTQCGFVDLPKKNVTVDFTTNISSSGRYYHYINTSQAFMLMSAGDSATDTTTVRMTDFTITGNITNSTTLWFERGSTNYVGKVTWCLIEGPMKVQSGFTNITNVSNALRYSEVTLGNQVNSSQSVVFINTRTDEPAASNTQLNRVLAEFLNDTQLRFSVASALNGINISISWYAVEFANDVSIQKGYSNVASALQSNASINPVNVTRAFVYNTWNISNQNGVIEMFTTNLTNSTSIQFQRGSTTGTAIIHYSVIELPNGSVVQWGSNSSATGTRVVFNSTINPATNLSRAFPFVTWKATTGGTHFPSDFWEYNLTNLSSQLSIVLDRFLGGGNYQFVWQIIEFNESSSTTFFGDSTTTTSSTTSSSSTLPHANLTLYLRNSSFTGLYQNITAFTNDSVNITSKDEYPADVNMTLFVINYTGGKYNQNTSKSFLQNITTFWTNGSFLVNITWEGNTTFFGNSTAFYVDVVATSTTSSSTTSTTTSTSTTTTAEEEVVSAPSTGGGSSGGSGGGTRIGEIIQKPTETSYLVPLLSPGELKISVDDPYSNIISVLLDTNREMHNSKINIKNINIPPAEVSLFGDNALDYYEISTINLPNRAISEAVINFRYKKAESVGLFLYSDDGKWNELNSREIRSDDYYTYYEAISNKLGYFVISKKITGEKIRLESEPINTKLVKNIKIIKDKIKTIGRGDKVAVITVINIILLIFIGVIILLIYGMKKLRMK